MSNMNVSYSRFFQRARQRVVSQRHFSLNFSPIFTLAFWLQTSSTQLIYEPSYAHIKHLDILQNTLPGPYSTNQTAFSNICRVILYSSDKDSSSTQPPQQQYVCTYILSQSHSHISPGIKESTLGLVLASFPSFPTPEHKHCNHESLVSLLTWHQE